MKYRQNFLPLLIFYLFATTHTCVRKPYELNFEYGMQTMRRLPLYIKNTLQLILSPSRGWEDISSQSITTNEIERELMFPLFILSGITVLIQYFYHRIDDITNALVTAFVFFVSYFATYSFAKLFFSYRMAKYVEGEPNKNKNEKVIIYTLSLLSLTAIICNLLPFSFGLRIILPFCIALIGWKADNYLRVKESENLSFVFLILFSLILPPIIIQTLFDWILTL